MEPGLVVLIKGAGEMASGVAWRLFKSHFRVALTERPQPLAVRRGVSFCEAAYEGKKLVEGVEAVRVLSPQEIPHEWARNRIPLLEDPELKLREILEPDVLVEATLSKRNTGISMDDAPLVIALGPGYEAGRDAHYVVETNRGHNLGRLYDRGRAEPNTGVPGEIGGRTYERVLRAPADGIFETGCSLGQPVSPGDIVARVGGDEVAAGIGGVLRGLLRPGTRVRQGLKVGDIDPRGQADYVNTISEKARAIGGAVLEAILRVYNT
ncbi:MAG: selenium-dependent molybdenum cofactor biosynthesis protein YqeB [Pseudomonadota bacterium]